MDYQPLHEPGPDLPEAREAYAAALDNLEAALPHKPSEPVVVDPSVVSWPEAVLQALGIFPRALRRGPRTVAGSTGQALRGALERLKTRLVCLGQPRPLIVSSPQAARRDAIRGLLLETLWARDHVQEALERRNGAPYATKRAALEYVMENEARLQQLGLLALEAAGSDTSDLRDSQPVMPAADHWWWFLTYPRAKRARRLSTLWFVLAIIPALASVVLITLLAQRLAINGPDLLSGASVVAQVGLGIGSILAGRELLGDLILKGTRVSWEGQVTFLLASVFLVVVVIFYFFAPPAAALVYNVFGQQAIGAGNAAEAELYLESAARLDPDPHAAALLEVGCLYQTLGAPDRAQNVFERVLEADSRLLLARYHLAELYSDRGEHDKALQLLEDGLNLLETGRTRMSIGEADFLPGIDTETRADQIEYLLRLARGRAYLESSAPEQAKGNLRDAEAFFNLIADEWALGLPSRNDTQLVPERMNLACGQDDSLEPFIINTEMNLHYHLARTYDALCDDDATVIAAREEWRLVRNGRPTSSRQEAWRDDAVTRLSSGMTCADAYGLAGAPTPTATPDSEPTPVG